MGVRGAKTSSADGDDMTMEIYVGTIVAVSAAWFQGLWALAKRSLLMHTALLLRQQLPVSDLAMSFSGVFR
jgi:hypothetical protein